MRSFFCKLSGLILLIVVLLVNQSLFASVRYRSYTSSDYLMRLGQIRRDLKFEASATGYSELQKKQILAASYALGQNSMFSLVRVLSGLESAKKFWTNRLHSGMPHFITVSPKTSFKGLSENEYILERLDEIKSSIHEVTSALGRLAFLMDHLSFDAWCKSDVMVSLELVDLISRLLEGRELKNFTSYHPREVDYQVFATLHRSLCRLSEDVKGLDHRLLRRELEDQTFSWLEKNWLWTVGVGVAAVGGFVAWYRNPSHLADLKAKYEQWEAAVGHFAVEVAQPAFKNIWRKFSGIARKAKSNVTGRDNKEVEEDIGVHIVELRKSLAKLLNAHNKNPEYSREKFIASAKNERMRLFEKFIYVRFEGEKVEFVDPSYFETSKSPLSKSSIDINRIQVLRALFAKNQLESEDLSMKLEFVQFMFDHPQFDFVASLDQAHQDVHGRMTLDTPWVSRLLGLSSEKYPMLSRFSELNLNTSKLLANEVVENTEKLALSVNQGISNVGRRLHVISSTVFLSIGIPVGIQFVKSTSQTLSDLIYFKRNHARKEWKRLFANLSDDLALINIREIDPYLKGLYVRTIMLARSHMTSAKFSEHHRLLELLELLEKSVDFDYSLRVIHLVEKKSSR